MRWSGLEDRILVTIQVKNKKKQVDFPEWTCFFIKERRRNEFTNPRLSGVGPKIGGKFKKLGLNLRRSALVELSLSL